MSLNFITKLLVLLLLPLLFTAVSCNKPTEPPPPPENYALEIIAADASCTEVWIDVKTPNTLLPQIFTLTENGEEKGSVKIDKADTTIVIENLLPKKSYKYQLNNNEHKSNETEITTLDTTSHNFTWQTFEFGEYGNSLIWDVAIIDENNIWAVGEIYMNDANGNPDPQSYNAVHWDGAKWELKKIGNQGGWACHTVFAFSAIDIWFEGTINWDGSNYTVHQNGWPLMPNGDGWRINKMWGSSRNDLYAVGNGGNIAHWNGSSWRKMESGTQVDLLDVYGTPDGKTIWACGYSGDYAVTVLLRYNGNTWSKVYEGSPNNQNNNEYIGPISGVWTKSKYFWVYVVYSG
ncbi:MAG: glucosyl transferase [Ignavibacteria bacterium]|nr:glucosyl transferase [Ignavibacteria bacterium]